MTEQTFNGIDAAQTTTPPLFLDAPSKSVEPEPHGSPCTSDYPARHCENCGEAFEPRRGNGGKPQRFCKPECRTAFNAQRSQRRPTCSAQSENPGGDTAERPTASQRREMLIAGLAAFDRKSPQPTPAQTVDEAIAAGTVPFSDPRTVERPDDAPDEFDWLNSEAVLIQEQRATAVYRNSDGDVVIRQRQDWNEENDPFVVIADKNLQKLIDELSNIASEGKT